MCEQDEGYKINIMEKLDTRADLNNKQIGWGKRKK